MKVLLYDQGSNMKKMIYNPQPISTNTNIIDGLHYAEDTYRIMAAFEENGYEITKQDAQIAWRTYSEEYYCAGWLMLPESNQHIYNILLPFFKEVQPFDWDKWLKDTEELRKNVDWDDVQEAIDKIRHPERHMWTRLPKLPEDPSLEYLVAHPDDDNPEYGCVAKMNYDDHEKKFYYFVIGKRMYREDVYAWQVCPIAPKIREAKE